MTDPVSKTEIEDVLSSIRRLVSDGDISGAQKQPDTPRERYVLTPALRVADDTAPFIAKPEHRVDLPANSMDAPQQTTHLMPPQAQLPRDRTQLEATIAELEAAVTRQSEEWEPDGDEDDSGDSPIMAWPGRVTDDQSARIADADEAELVPEDEAARETADEADMDTESYPVSRHENAVPETSVPFDDGLLHQLVADALREELRGPLGAKITQNVRKLVRQEISRALAAEKLD